MQIEELIAYQQMHQTAWNYAKKFRVPDKMIQDASMEAFRVFVVEPDSNLNDLADLVSLYVTAAIKWHVSMS